MALKRDCCSQQRTQDNIAWGYQAWKIYEDIQGLVGLILVYSPLIMLSRHQVLHTPNP